MLSSLQTFKDKDIFFSTYFDPEPLAYRFLRKEKEKQNLEKSF